MNNKKAFARLGLKVDEILKNSFAKERMGRVTRDELQMFWIQISEKKNASLQYLNFICDKLTNMLSGKACGVSADTLMTTIQFITLFVNFNAGHSTVTSFVSGFNKQANAQNFPSAKDVIRTLEHRNTEITGSDKLCRHLLVQCQMLHTVDGFRKLSDPITYPTFVDQDVKSAELSLVFEFLRDRAAETPVVRRALLLNLVPHLMTLPLQMKANPLVAETTLLAILYMIQQFVRSGPVAAANELAKCINSIRDYYLWPLPFGQVAKECLGVLTRESLVPGAALTCKLEREHGVAAVAGMDDEFGQKARAVYYFTNEADKDSRMLSLLMELPKMESKEPVAHDTSLPPVVKCLLFMCSLHCELPLSPGDVQLFRQLSEIQAMELYDKAKKVLDEAAAAKTIADAKKIRSEGLTKLRAVLARIAGSPSGSPIKLPHKLPPEFVPPSPPIAHFQVNGAYQTYSTMTETELEAYSDSVTPFPEVPVLAELTRILQFHKGASDKSVDVELRLVVSGGNEVLHGVLTAYCHILQNSPELLNGIIPRFFVVPFHRNHLASYLARYDSWYNRHIYVPFRTRLFLVPGIMGDFQHMANDPTKLTPVGQLFRRFTESYVREAVRTTDVQCWQMELWSEPPNPSKGSVRGNLPELVVPCIMRCEVGRLVAAREFQKNHSVQVQDEKKRPYAELKLDDILRDKAFQQYFTPPELRIEFQKVDVDGKPVKVINQHGKESSTVIDHGMSYESCVLANIPLMNDRVFPPDPTAPWLEMHAEPHAKSRSQQRFKSNPLSQEPQQHVGMVNITSLSGKFVVRVDGQNFGPLHRVRLTPLRIKQKQVKFPVQTFFPVDM